MFSIMVTLFPSSSTVAFALRWRLNPGSHTCSVSSLLQSEIPRFSPLYLFIVLLDNSYPNKYEVMPHCHFNLRFPGD